MQKIKQSGEIDAVSHRLSNSRYSVPSAPDRVPKVVVFLRTPTASIPCTEVETKDEEEEEELEEDGTYSSSSSTSPSAKALVRFSEAS